jgi:Protein of unknown function (DUF3108)
MRATNHVTAMQMRGWGLTLVGACCALLSIAPGAMAAEPPLPAHVRADYKIIWNGIELGDFIWDSSLRGGQYKLSSNANITALFGAYKWQGVTRATGNLARGDVRPSAYAFKYDATDKNGRIDMRFAKGAVTDLQSEPVDNGSIERVALKPAHMVGVLDPLSAVMALSTPVGGKLDAGSPCTRRLAVIARLRSRAPLGPTRPMCARCAMCRSPGTRTTPRISSWPATTASRFGSHRSTTRTSMCLPIS